MKFRTIGMLVKDSLNTYKITLGRYGLICSDVNWRRVDSIYYSEQKIYTSSKTMRGNGNNNNPTFAILRLGGLGLFNSVVTPKITVNISNDVIPSQKRTGVFPDF